MLSLIMLVSSSITVFAEEEQAIQEENGEVNVQVVDAFEKEMHEVDTAELTESDCMPVKAPEKEIRLEEGTKLEKTGMKPRSGLQGHMCTNQGWDYRKIK